jgi:hypothetical protein
VTAARLYGTLADTPDDQRPRLGRDDRGASRVTDDGPRGVDVRERPVSCTRARWRRFSSAVGIVGLSTLVAPLGAQTLCNDRATLPAYAHNDYDNAAPLHDALRLGYAGVEADLVLVDGVLLVAHARRDARPGRTFEALYLRPLRELVARCTKVISPTRRFLLNVELKERSRAAYDSLAALLGRYQDVVGSVESASAASARVARQREAPVEAVLVGWHPPIGELAERQTIHARVQLKIGSTESTDIAPSALVRLVSLDYGKTIGRDRSRAGAWLGALRSARDAMPGRVARVYNVPVRAEVYVELLEAGVDLIGTEDLSGTRRELARVHALRR